MRTLAIIQSIFAAAFVLFGLVALFGIGITGLLFLVPGVLFAATAAVAQEKSRASMAVALVADAPLAYLAVRKLEVLLTAQTTGVQLLGVGPLDYLVPSLALTLIGVGTIALALDWRALRSSSWF
ncbi:hypothetical protein GCM10027321_34900 [Massilia terrae]|uniref:Uncharacterized protein n=1 Tax=Massilia terrae TaxID=1811224 RepID=A0ABT2D5S4_9BURK|nr:hypothetical protein [Massilia terrae]MCS0660698.1 hypothetical protein [Massilia terrae]